MARASGKGYPAVATRNTLGNLPGAGVILREWLPAECFLPIQTATIVSCVGVQGEQCAFSSWTTMRLSVVA